MKSYIPYSLRRSSESDRNISPSASQDQGPSARPEMKPYVPYSARIQAEQKDVLLKHAKGGPSDSAAAGPSLPSSSEADRNISPSASQDQGPSARPEMKPYVPYSARIQAEQKDVLLKHAKGGPSDSAAAGPSLQSSSEPGRSLSPSASQDQGPSARPEMKPYVPYSARIQTRKGDVLLKHAKERPSDLALEGPSLRSSSEPDKNISPRSARPEYVPYSARTQESSYESRPGHQSPFVSATSGDKINIDRTGAKNYVPYSARFQDKKETENRIKTSHMERPVSPSSTGRSFQSSSKPQKAFPSDVSRVTIHPEQSDLKPHSKDSLLRRSTFEGSRGLPGSAAGDEESVREGARTGFLSGRPFPGSPHDPGRSPSSDLIPSYRPNNKQIRRLNLSHSNKYIPFSQRPKEFPPPNLPEDRTSGSPNETGNKKVSGTSRTETPGSHYTPLSQRSSVLDETPEEATGGAKGSQPSQDNGSHEQTGMRQKGGSIYNTYVPLSQRASVFPRKTIDPRTQDGTSPEAGRGQRPATPSSGKQGSVGTLNSTADLSVSFRGFNSTPPMQTSTPAVMSPAGSSTNLAPTPEFTPYTLNYSDVYSGRFDSSLDSSHSLHLSKDFSQDVTDLDSSGIDHKGRLPSSMYRTERSRKSGMNSEGDVHLKQYSMSSPLATKSTSDVRQPGLKPYIPLSQIRLEKPQLSGTELTDRKPGTKPTEQKHHRDSTRSDHTRSLQSDHSTKVDSTELTLQNSYRKTDAKPTFVPYIPLSHRQAGDSSRGRRETLEQGPPHQETLTHNLARPKVFEGQQTLGARFTGGSVPSHQERCACSPPTTEPVITTDNRSGSPWKQREHNTYIPLSQRRRDVEFNIRQPPVQEPEQILTERTKDLKSYTQNEDVNKIKSSSSISPKITGFRQDGMEGTPKGPVSTVRHLSETVPGHDKGFRSLNSESPRPPMQKMFSFPTLGRYSTKGPDTSHIHTRFKVDPGKPQTSHGDRKLTDRRTDGVTVTKEIQSAGSAGSALDKMDQKSSPSLKPSSYQETRRSTLFLKDEPRGKGDRKPPLDLNTFSSRFGSRKPRFTNVGDIMNLFETKSSKPNKVSSGSGEESPAQWGRSRSASPSPSPGSSAVEQQPKSPSQTPVKASRPTMLDSRLKSADAKGLAQKYTNLDKFRSVTGTEREALQKYSSPDKSRSLTRTEPEALQKFSSPDKSRYVTRTESEGLQRYSSPDKYRSVTRAESEGLQKFSSPDKSRYVTRTESEGLQKFSSPDKSRYVTRTESEGLQRYSSPDKYRSATRSETEGLQRYSSPDKSRSVTRTESEGPQKFSSPDKSRPVTRTESEGLQRYSSPDKYRSATRSETEGLQRYSSPDKSRSVTRTESEGPQKFSSPDKSRPVTRTESEGLQRYSSPDKSRSVTRTESEGPQKFSSPDKSRPVTRTESEGLQRYSSPDKYRSATRSETEGLQRYSSPDKSRSVTRTESEGPQKFSSPDKSRPVTRTESEGLQRYSSPDKYRSATRSETEGLQRYSSPDKSRSVTRTESEGPQKFSSPDKSRSVTRTEPEAPQKFSSPDKSRSVTRTEPEGPKSPRPSPTPRSPTEWRNSRNSTTSFESVYEKQTPSLRTRGQWPPKDGKGWSQDAGHSRHTEQTVSLDRLYDRIVAVSDKLLKSGSVDVRK